MNLEDLLNMDVTTASKSEEKQSDAPGIISVLSNDDIRRFGGTTLADVLNRVPGLASSSVYMTDRSIISARGDQITNSSNHVLFLINGRPIREVQEGGINSELLETFPVNLIERIEVIKGPGSVLYGSNAFSAVINIITEKAEKTGLSVSGLAGSESAFGTMGNLNIKYDDLMITTGGRYYKKADWETNYSAAAGPDVITVQQKIPNYGSGAFLNASYKNFSLTSTYNDWQTSYFIPDYMAIFPAYGNSHWKKFFGNLGYDASMNESWNSSFNVTYSQSQFTVSSWPTSERNSHEIIGEWTNTVTLSGKSKLVIGGLFNRVEGTEEVEAGPGATLTVSDAVRNNYSFYSQVDYKVINNLTLIGGVQANKIEGIDLGFVPRGGVIWYPLQRVHVKALYSQAFRAPSINEISLDHPAMKGNANLKSEKVGTFDVSIGYRGVQGQASINYFNSTLTNMIYQDRTGEYGPFPIYVNHKEKVYLQGVEFEGKYYVNKSLYLVGSMIYQKAEDHLGNTGITPIADLGIKAGISYDWEKGVSLGLFNNYQGELNNSFACSVNPCPGSYNLLSLHGEFSLNKIFNMNISQQFSVLVQVDNLLDKEVWLPAWGLSPGQSLPYIKGRAIYAGLGLEI